MLLVQDGSFGCFFPLPHYPAAQVDLRAVPAGKLFQVSLLLLQHAIGQRGFQLVPAGGNDGAAYGTTADLLPPAGGGDCTGTRRLAVGLPSSEVLSSEFRSGCRLAVRAPMRSFWSRSNWMQHAPRNYTIAMEACQATQQTICSNPH